MHDMHVVCLYREIQLMSLFHYILAQHLVGLILALRTMCNFCHVALQLQISGINRGKQDTEPQQRSKNRDRCGNSPARNGVHERSDSWPGAVSSAQISSECGVHSAADMPEMCRSSSRSVPWP